MNRKLCERCGFYGHSRGECQEKKPSPESTPAPSRAKSESKCRQNADDEYLEDIESECKPVPKFWWYTSDDEFFDDIKSVCKPIRKPSSEPNSDDEFFYF